MRTKGFTLIEVLVVAVIGLVVLGMVMDAFLETSKATAELTDIQEARQEALLIAGTVERTIRFRVAPEEIAEADIVKGGAAQSAPAGGEPSGSAVPISMRAELLTTHPAAARTATETTASAGAKRAPAAAASQDQFSSVPASIKPLLTTGTVQMRPKPPSGIKDDLFREQQIAIHTFSASYPPEITRVVLGNLANAEGEVHASMSEAVVHGLKRNPARTRNLGSRADTFLSRVSFRYASEFDGLNAKWTTQTLQAPKLIEYTVRVWPNRPESLQFSKRKSPSGLSAGFELTSAVEVR